MKIVSLLFFTMAILIACEHSNAARILAAVVYPGPSHYMMHGTLIRELSKRGHEITFITALPMGENLGENYTEILIEPVYDFWTDIQDHFQSKSIFDMTKLNYRGFLKIGHILGEKTTEHALKHPKVQEIFNRKDTRNVYDLLIVEQFFHEAFLALGLKYDIPVITCSTFGPLAYFSQMMGFIAPWSFVPQGYIPLDDRMTFWQRLQNTICCFYEYLFKEFEYFPKQDALVEKYLSHLPVSKMEKNISMILMNNYSPLSTPRPSVGGIVEVGGMHIYPPKPLPADIKRFLDEATHGVVYFSFGSNIQSRDLPSEMIKMILTVFSTMKQRFLWKFEDEGIARVPSNVMIKKWMPQNGILAHPNVRVFITHGGLFGTLEALHYGIPMLGMPIYSDQYVNLNRAVRSGYALTLNFQIINKDNFKNALRELLVNPSYKKNIQRASAIFRDRPMSARETAVYWVEYIIRHKGTRHLRMAGIDLAWYEFYLLDVIGFIATGALISVAVIYLAIKMLIQSRLGKSKKD